MWCLYVYIYVLKVVLELKSGTYTAIAAMQDLFFTIIFL